MSFVSPLTLAWQKSDSELSNYRRPLIGDRRSQCRGEKAHGSEPHDWQATLPNSEIPTQCQPVLIMFEINSWPFGFVNRNYSIVQEDWNPPADKARPRVTVASWCWDEIKLVNHSVFYVVSPHLHSLCVESDQRLLLPTCDHLAIFLACLFSFSLKFNLRF